MTIFTNKCISAFLPVLLAVFFMYVHTQEALKECVVRLANEKTAQPLDHIQETLSVMK